MNPENKVSIDVIFVIDNSINFRCVYYLYGIRKLSVLAAIETEVIFCKTVDVFLQNAKLSETVLPLLLPKDSLNLAFLNRNDICPSYLLISSKGRRRGNKPIVTPVHRFQSTDNGPTQHMRRQHQSSSHVRHSSPQSCATSAVNNAIVNGSTMTMTSHTGEVDSGVCLEANSDTHLDPGQNSRLVRVGGLIRYGMWASFGLITVSVAVTKIFINNQGTFEILLLCTLGMLSVGLLGSCILSACRTKREPEFIAVTSPTHRPEVEIQEVISHREETILPVESPQIIPPQTILELNGNATVQTELPPPPYHIAVLLPKTKEELSEDLPPPTYENALR